MKKLFLLFTLFTSILGFCIVEPSPHFSSVHTSETISHVSSARAGEPISHVAPTESIAIREMPTYSSIKTVSEPHLCFSKNTALFYILLLNNHTHKYDTISAPSKDELRLKVVKLTEPKNKLLPIAIISFTSMALMLFAYTLFNNPNKKQE